MFGIGTDVLSGRYSLNTERECVGERVSECLRSDHMTVTIVTSQLSHTRCSCPRQPPSLSKVVLSWQTEIRASKRPGIEPRHCPGTQGNTRTRSRSDQSCTDFEKNMQCVRQCHDHYAHLPSVDSSCKNTKLGLRALPCTHRSELSARPTATSARRADMPITTWSTATPKMTQVKSKVASLLDPHRPARDSKIASLRQTWCAYHRDPTINVSLSQMYMRQNNSYWDLPE